MNVDEFIHAFNSAKNFSELEDLAEIGVKLLESLEGSERGRVLGTLGNIYYALHKFEKAEEMYLDALNIYIKLADEDEQFIPYLVGCLYNLGNLYQVLRKYEEAEKAYTDALKLLGVRRDRQSLAVMTALGTMYAKLDLREQAEKYLVEALNTARTTGDQRLIGMLLNNLAVVYQRSGRKREAGTLLKMALDLMEDNNPNLAAVLQNILPFLDEKEVEEVLSRLEKIENLQPDLQAKIVYFKARKAEKKGEIREALNLYMEAGCLAFLAYRNFGFQSINFMHCFDKVIEGGGEMAEDALSIKKLILKYYYGNQSVEPSFDSRLGRIIEKIINGESLEEEVVLTGVLADTIRVIARDISGAQG